MTLNQRARLALVIFAAGAVALCVTTAIVVSGRRGAATVTDAGAAVVPCASTGASPAPVRVRTPSGALGVWDREQVGHGAAIVATGHREGVPPRGWVIAVATAMQESSLRNLPGGDRDSVGLFQQRPSQGWGSPQQLADPDYAARAFYRKLLKVRDWRAKSLTVAAQEVQRSALPEAYARWEGDAVRLVSAYTGLKSGALVACTAQPGPQGWIAPLRAPVGSGFRSEERRGHIGVDIIAARGAPVRAAAAGTVSAVVCNVPAGQSCDTDGSAEVGGCGWYLDLDHPGGIVTRYCHLLVRPFVEKGQSVAAGQVIGVVGSSGNSSEPHLHFEVHDGDRSDATAVDPVPFLAERGAPIGKVS